ncbi:MAG: monofunctional biosynthetic peptidoglycan transglycosylase [Chitinophagaceae bacterium]|nr:monofunctional biosynthetic peptidoglycan transglycosylase [Chitinophagaceae bacterium]MCW5929836.1 monofunctional biosynthetic peptidoglycan transglycosylase [Chitinophagaceae bacterium]
MSKFLSKCWKLIKRIFWILFIGQFVYIIMLRWVDPPVTLTQLGSLLRGDGLKRDYIDLEKISPYAGLAVIASEDQLFPGHNGFDWKSIQKAMEKNQNRKRIAGASTISQQVAKNVFLWQGRTWFRKGLETYFTFMIELVWGKKRILEVYLNVAETGKGIFGIEAASQHYFNKPASKLTKTQAAMIAASLPNPARYTVKPLSKYVNARYPWVLEQMNNLEAAPDIQQVLPGPEKVAPAPGKGK